MPKISYVNGRYLPHAQAAVHIEDRGYQFSDGVYEFIAFYNGRLLDGDLHIDRMERSLKELRIPMPVTRRAFEMIMAELMEKNGKENGSVYIQVTRGSAKRDHPFPKNPPKPSLVLVINGPKPWKPEEAQEGVSVITAPDLRWQRRDIKSVSLLANILARQQSVEANTREAWLFEKDNTVTEGSYSNAYIVNAKGEVITRQADHSILGGITREVVLKIARKNGIKVAERPFTVKEALAAKEAFLTSTSGNVLPIVRIDGRKIGTGKPGEVTRRLQALYQDHIRKMTGRADAA